MFQVVHVLQEAQAPHEMWSRPSTSSTPEDVVIGQWLVQEDGLTTIKDIAAIVNVAYRTVQAILASFEIFTTLLLSVQLGF